MIEKKRIMVVDDFAYIRMLFQKAFQKLQNYEIIAVSTGREALMKLSDSIKPIDLLILDINLPDINGLNLLRGIRKSKLNTKVIIVTAYSNDELKKNLNGLNVLQIFDKPIVVEEMIAFVNELFGNSTSVKVNQDSVKNVIIIADVNRIISLLRKSLEHKDLNIDSFTDGYEALSHLKLNKKKYDLAILDYKLQGIEGIELAKELKSSSADTEIFIITAFPDKNLILSCRENNITKIFKKPLEMFDFREKVFNAMKLK